MMANSILTSVLKSSTASTTIAMEFIRAILPERCPQSGANAFVAAQSLNICEMLLFFVDGRPSTVVYLAQTSNNNDNN